MVTLNISDFSCIKNANLIVAPINVIIGPQGSGKSVTTKLLYFLADISTNFMISAERGDNLDQYKKLLSKQFLMWFPPAAWGNNRFNITFGSGPFSVRILRKINRGKPIDEVSFTFSDWFGEIYDWTLNLYDVSRQESVNIDLRRELSENINRVYRVNAEVARRIAKDLGDDHIFDQTFIPAGRAFFTSIGRLVAGIEQPGSLDPITLKFARLFANIRDRRAFRHSAFKERGEEFLNRRNTFMQKLFGGEIKFENEIEFVEAIDGRKVPFSSLSSGQQELIPIWSLLDYFSERDAFIGFESKRTRSRFRELIYIEEPEAHLFPSAQSLLMEFLIGSLVNSQVGRNLTITTHSPYIMGKLNIFLKAGQLAKRKKRNQEINEIVPRECWINSDQLSALAIENGTFVNLIDEDGLIDARYLDQISEETSREFSRLLEIESEI